MAGYLRKYVGTYRVVAEYNQSANDFPRKLDGTLDNSFDDLYIACSYSNRIYHYGRSTLVAYIPSIGRGRNILKALHEKMLGDVSKYEEDKTDEDGNVLMTEDGIPKTIFNHEAMYEEMVGAKLLSLVEVTDEEILFYFKADDIETVATLLKAKTGGASISPFSSKNLKKSDYTIPEEDLEAYREITKDVPKEDLLSISRVTKRFLSEKAAKKLKGTDIKADMKLKAVKSKEYIHIKGLWTEYLAFLRKELQNVK